MHMDANQSSEVIDAMGGTGEVARLCEVSDAAVSQWRKYGIPKAQLKFLRLARPDIFPPEPKTPEHRAA